jgi:CRP-like cAMP-binding protein
MNSNSVEKIIATISRLIPLSPEEKEVLKCNIGIKKVKANEVIHSEGNICDFEAFIEKGVFRTYYLIDGKDKIINFYQENQWLSDFKSFTLQVPSKIYIQALEDSEIAFFKSTQVKLLAARISNWDKLGKVFFEKLFIDNFNHIESLLISSPEERYTHLLKNRPNLMNRIPQYFIAQYVGVQPESLSRIRKRIANKNLS